MAQGIFDDIQPVRRPAPVERPGSAPVRRPPAAAPAVSPAAPMEAAPEPQAPGMFDDIPMQQEQVGMLEDVAKSAGSGLVKGGIGLATLPGTVEQLGRMGVNYVGEKLTGQPDTVSKDSILPGYRETKQFVEDKITGPLYKPKTTAGEYAGTIAEFAPGVLFPAGAAGGLAARVGLNVVAPAVASETAGQMTKGTSYEPYARLAGGLVGGMLPAIGGRAISPGATDPTRRRMGDVLAREGVELTAGDRTGGQTLRYAESVSQTTPFAGRRLTQVKQQQGEQFTRAALSRAGIQADRALPEVIDQGFQRLGNMFQQVGGSAMVALSAPLQQRLSTIVRNYERITEPSLVNPLPRSIIDDITGLVQQATTAGAPPALDGARYLAWRADIGQAARGTTDARSQRALYDIQRVLDDAAESYLRTTNPRLAPQMAQARREYRNLLAIERASLGAGEGAALGLISPAQLAQATKTVHGSRNYARGRGDLAEMSRAGVALLQPMPQSGTAPRALLGGIGSAIGLGMAGPAGALTGAAAGAAGQAIAGRVLGARPVQAYLGNQLAAPVANMQTGSRMGALPGATASSNDPLEVTIRPDADAVRKRALAEQLMRR